MREPLSIRVTTYTLLALFVFMVAVPLFWMLTTALKTNKDLYEDFTYLPRRPTLQHFVRVIERDGLLTNIWNSFAVASVTTAVTVVVSAFAAFSIVRYKYRGREWIGPVHPVQVRPADRRCSSCRSTRSWSRSAWATRSSR
jgi:multiple sugar transport system permease protein